MRLSVEKIKEAILHADHVVRETAVFYFAKSRSNDPTVMPMVIQAIERWGLDAFPNLSAANINQTLGNLVQTDDTVAWLIREIERVGSSTGERDANYGASLITALRHADVAILKRHESRIQAMQSLDNNSKKIIADRILVSSLTPDVLWREVVDFCDAEHDPEKLSNMDLERVGSVVQVLSRYPDQVSDRVLGILSYEDAANEWLEGLTIRLAGEARLEAAISFLVDRFDQCGDWACEEATEALARIGTDAVVQEIAERYSDSEWPFRVAASTMLEDIHTDLSVQTCLELFDQEDDLELQFHLLESVLMNFSPDGIEPARQYIINTPKNPDVLEVRSALLIACKVMGETFPEYEGWLEDSKNDTEFRKRWYEDHPLVMDEEDEFYDEYLEGDLDEMEDDQSPVTFIRRGQQVGRNDPCPCGSGKKYKKCCFGKPALEETDENHSAAIGGLRQGKSTQEFPIGTVAFYGPDDRTTTKIVAGVIKQRGFEPSLERWVGRNVKENPKVQRQIKEFFTQHGVKSVIATETNLGCPHEEGLDFPLGEDCPFCPYWAGNQGSNRRD